MLHRALNQTSSVSAAGKLLISNSLGFASVVNVVNRSTLCSMLSWSLLERALREGINLAWINLCALHMFT